MDDTCHTTGDVTITQTGDAFTGQVSQSTEACSGSQTPSGNANDNGSLTHGVVTGETVTFLQPEGVCSYLGSAPGDPNDPGAVIDGDVTCTEGTGSPHFWWSGTWTLTRSMAP